MGSRVRVLAAAKVNLTLEVLGRRPDGYHEIASVIATVDLRDDVRVATAHDLEVVLRPDVGAPKGEDLATLAVRAFAAATGREPHAHVVVRKRIPVAAGLGGGSSDAGAVLRSLAHLTRSRDVDLTAVAAAVGSDVPFFAADRPLAYVRGRGELVEHLLPPRDLFWVSLVILPDRLATKDVFGAVRDGERGTGQASAEMAKLASAGALTPAGIRELACNDLSSPAERVLPRIREARDAARARGVRLMLSGSGPSLFAVADDRAEAIQISRSLRRLGLGARPRAVCVTAPIVRL